MSLTPLDILHREFRRGFRGYSDREVQEFLQQVSQEFEAVLAENARLKEQVTNLQQRLEQFERLEETMHNALVVAQRTAEETKLGAQKRAELIIADAERQSREMLEKAHAHLADEEARLSELRQQKVRFELEFRALLDTFRKMLDASAVEETAHDSSPALAPQTPPTQESTEGAWTAGAIASERAAVSAMSPDDENGQPADDESAARPRLINWSRIGAHPIA